MVSDVIVPERHVVIPEEILPKNDVVFSPKNIAGAPTEEVVTTSKQTKKKKNNNNEDDLISQLWHIFSHYAMRRYPKDVDHISDAIALEFLRDCKFLRNSTEENTRQVSQQHKHEYSFVRYARVARRIVTTIPSFHTRTPSGCTHDVYRFSSTSGMSC